MNRIGSLNNKEQMEEMTKLSIESRKPGAKNEKAGKKQAVTKAINNAFFDCPTRTTYQNKHIKPAVLDYLTDQMFGKDGKWTKDFIDSQLKEAKSNPNSRAADRLAAGLFNEALWDSLDTYLRKATQEDVDFEVYKVRQSLYDKQKEVYDDLDDTKFLIINSRRSGKTELLGRLAAREVLTNPDAHVVYINRNSSAAIRQIRGPLASALEKTNLRIIKGSVESQEIHFSTGGQMLIIGNNNSADINKLRGERISLCIMDECGHQRNTRELMREVIGPAMRDYGQEARLYMVGTPPRNKGTYVEEVYNEALERGWKLFHWTFADNPFIPDRDKVIEEVCKENGCSPDSAFIQREYFGRMDAYDDEALVFHDYKTIEDIDAIKNQPVWSHAYIGVDYGFEDKAAVVSIVADERLKRAYIVKSWSEAKQPPSRICEEVAKQREWLLNTFRISHQIAVICDTNEKGISYEMYSTYKIPCVYNAYKYNKDMAIDQLAEWLRSGTFMVSKKAESVIEDLDNTMFERDEETDKILHEIDDDIYHPNSAFAILYASRQFAFDCMGLKELNKTAKEVIESVHNQKY